MPILRGLSLMWKEVTGGYRQEAAQFSANHIEVYEFNKIRETLIKASPAGLLGASHERIYNACIVFGQANFHGGNRPTIPHVEEFVKYTLNLDYILYRDRTGVLHCEERE